MRQKTFVKLIILILLILTMNSIFQLHTLSLLQKYVRKVVGGFGKKSCVSPGVRKPGNTCASPTASLAVKSGVKPQYNQLQPTNYTQSSFRYGEFKD